MEQSTDISFLSDLNNKDKNLSLSVKDLTLYSKSVSIENKFTHELLKYSPIKDRLVTDDYVIRETLYDVIVAPTRVFIGKDKLSDRLVAIKQVNKKKLSSYLMFEFIYNEFVITKYLSSYLTSVVQVIDYYDDEENLSMVMEYCDRPNFFDELLENVS